MPRKIWPEVYGVALYPLSVFLHEIIGNASDFLQGFGHPISGLDHLLAMVLVGMLAFQIGGRALWLVPGTFVAVMAVGGTLGMAGVRMPLVEVAIGISVILLGATVTLGVRLPVAATVIAVGIFAIFHGHAHGLEMPLGTATYTYAAGFMVATAMLHLAGICLSSIVGRISGSYSTILTRLPGGAAALGGLAILFRLA